MASWILVIILAYLFFALASLGDKLVLSGKPNPTSYTFYVGLLGLLVVVFIPFISFSIPNSHQIGWVVLDALVYILGVYSMYSALERFDVSKVIATIGATQPIFIFALTWLFWQNAVLPAVDLLAFILLFLGSIVISLGKSIKINSTYLKITIFSSLMFSLDYIISKEVFLSQPFLQGFIWIRIFVFVFAMFLLLKKGAIKEIFSKKVIRDKKTQALFVFAQASGGVANILQSFAISLAPVAFLATINSLRGVQYVFLFILTLLISIFYPKILKEEISKGAILQKIFSITLIVVGLYILVVS